MIIFFNRNICNNYSYTRINGDVISAPLPPFSLPAHSQHGIIKAMESPLEPLIYYVILAVAASYLYKAVKQIVKKDVSFYKQEIYTDKSVEKWAIVDGLIKAFVATVCVVYAALCLVGIKVFWYVPVCIVLSLAAYLIGYRKILVKR